MTAPTRPTDLVPAARDVLASVGADPHGTAKLLVAGGVGTGKSSVLAAVRAAMRDAGRPVVARAPHPDIPAELAVVVDDAELLDGPELARLTDLASTPGATVVVAMQPLVHHPGVRGLATALSREGAPVVLGPLSPADVGRSVSATFGAPAPPDLVGLLVTSTGGLPFLLDAALAALDGGAEAVARAARVRLIERLRRLDESLLDTLLVLSLGGGLGPDDVAAALRMPAADARVAVDRARACGLVDPAYPDAFARSVHDGIRQVVGAARRQDVEVSLLRSQLELATLTADLAVRLAEHGLRDERLAAALTGFAARTQGRPARAARLYRAAADAGATASTPELADALALTGDSVTAGRLADGLLASEDPAERAAAARIAAGIAMHDGAASHAADLFRWLGPSADPAVTAAATMSFLAVGDAAAARAAAQAQPNGLPTSTARAARSATEGLVMTLDVPYPAAMARLGQAVTGDFTPSDVLPDTFPALVTLAALHGGDPVRARSVIGRVVAHDGDPERSGAIFVTHRHRLLLGWTHMQDGQLGAAAATLPGQGATSSLHRRDALWAAALRTAIARRSGDVGAMQSHWYSAMEVLAEYSADVFAVLPLGELWVAAARLRQVDRLQHVLDETFALLAGLGDPPLWSVPLHWAGVHAGILGNAPDAVAPHGQALTAAAAQSAFAKVLATAGRTWLRALARHVDPAEVAAAARGLALHGHTWDATRLASQAALQTTDPRVSQAMLALARDLKQTASGPESAALAAPTETADVTAPRAAPPGPASAQLSEREREVAELLLQGMPYRDIGAQLFISAKTVEHHVARIRRRLGAESRSEMLSMLRAQLVSASG